MENGESMNMSQVQDSFSMELVNQREPSKSQNDIMMRRMKNRERQRRYRARKRLEADLKKSSVPSVIEQSTPVPVVEPQSNGIVSNYSASVHCRRDWKKDARRAHILKDSEVFRNGSLITVPVLSSENHTLGFSSGSKAELSLQRESHPEASLDVGNATQRTTLGRRDWKADARKKKN